LNSRAIAASNGSNAARKSSKKHRRHNRGLGLGRPG
jgi:hypothetical protein